ncbi:hypothetical protein T11_15994 [Trichinella zimbabwensis]|uniref:Uncharacterized protein n=1 Tax=Trichinella zimbabwensis TaxID=268475 RepID=A0A0V1HKS8_9BILA|nr:hypothetical protein T11_15994 [Trichinella zimbabwensis]
MKRISIEDSFSTGRSSAAGSMTSVLRSESREAVADEQHAAVIKHVAVCQFSLTKHVLSELKETPMDKVWKNEVLVQICDKRCCYVPCNSPLERFGMSKMERIHVFTTLWAVVNVKSFQMLRDEPEFRQCYRPECMMRSDNLLASSAAVTMETDGKILPLQQHSPTGDNRNRSAKQVWRTCYFHRKFRVVVHQILRRDFPVMSCSINPLPSSGNIKHNFLVPTAFTDVLPTRSCMERLLLSPSGNRGIPNLYNTKTRYHKILSNNADRALLAAEKNCSGRNGADLVGVIFPLTGGNEAWPGQWHCRSTALKIAFARSDIRGRSHEGPHAASGGSNGAIIGPPARRAKRRSKKPNPGMSAAADGSLDRRLEKRALPSAAGVVPLALLDRYENKEGKEDELVYSVYRPPSMSYIHDRRLGSLDRSGRPELEKLSSPPAPVCQEVVRPTNLSVSTDCMPFFSVQNATSIDYVPKINMTIHHYRHWFESRQCSVLKDPKLVVETVRSRRKIKQLTSDIWYIEIGENTIVDALHNVSAVVRSVSAYQLVRLVAEG